MEFLEKIDIHTHMLLWDTSRDKRERKNGKRKKTRFDSLETLNIKK